MSSGGLNLLSSVTIAYEEAKEQLVEDGMLQQQATHARAC
jgi:hypothetical protein